MTPTTPAELAELADAIQERWAAGEPPDALAALAAHPVLAADRKLVIQLAHEEFCLRAEAGAAPDPVAFAARFPYPDDIAALFAVKSVLNRQFADSSPPRRPAVTLHPGDLVGGLRVLRLLGRGAFSDVYLVRNTDLGDRAEVLKVSTRGEEEARTLGPLTHPHLMSVFAAPSVNGHRAVVSPYLGLATGETLVSRAGGRAPTCDLLLRVVGERWADDPPVGDPPAFPVSANTAYPRAVLHVAAAVADALTYLHTHGIAHRDLKPSNLLFGPTGFPYLLDLNLADDGRGGRAAGTLAYAPPEVLARLAADRPDVATDWHAADVFSFAVLVFELLLARHPYLIGAALSRIDGHTVPDAAKSAQFKLAAVRMPLPPAVRRVLLDCLAVNPAERPTAGEVARVLAAAVAPRRRWVLMTAAAVLLTVGGVGAGGWAQFNNPMTGPTAPPVEDPDPTEPFARGCWLVKHGQSDVAVIPFQQASETDKTGRAAEWLGYCYARSSTQQRAIEFTDRAEAAGRKTAAVYANRAAAKMLLNDQSGAADDAVKALDIDHDCTPARLTRGLVVYKLQGRGVPISRAVLGELENACRGNEGHAGLWHDVAEARVRVVGADDDDRTRAIKAVEQSLRAGGRPTAFTMNKTIMAALKNDPHFQVVLATPAERTPAGIESQLVRPD